MVRGNAGIAAGIGLVLLAPGVVIGSQGQTAGHMDHGAPVGSGGLRSYYSVKYYLSEDAGIKDGYPEGRSMVIERKGSRIFLTIVTMQGTPLCFSGVRSGNTYVGTLDEGHPPYKNWVIALRKSGQGVRFVLVNHGANGYSEDYRRSSNASIKSLFGWNAWKQHQTYMRNC